MSVVAVHSWSVFTLLLVFNALLHRHSPLELASVISYTLLLALVESILLLLVVLTAGTLLSPLLRGDIVARGTVFIVLLSAWSMAFPYLLPVAYVTTLEPSRAMLRVGAQLLLLLLLLVALQVLGQLALRHRRLRGAAAEFAERTTVLAGLYLVADTVAVVWLVGHLLWRGAAI